MPDLTEQMMLDAIDKVTVEGMTQKTILASHTQIQEYMKFITGVVDVELGMEPCVFERTERRDGTSYPPD